MRIEYIDIKNFRGISSGKVQLNGHSVIIGDNNAGKSTIIEAIDLVIGPERLNRTPVIDEHDFYNGKYLVNGEESPKIEIEILVLDLAESQLTRFRYNIEFWDLVNKKLLDIGEIDKVDNEGIVEALRVKFVGFYDPENDDFEGETYFCSPEKENEKLSKFSRTDKRECGFLYLRALRTGTRALSMERGSLLDIILRLKEIRPKMWENILEQLKTTQVATDPSLGISEILTGVQQALREFVPSDWGSEPHLKVSNLTREHLRKTLTVFMSTSEDGYYVPFQHQGTGTINTMVLALLSMIAEEKKNVIFAMEEPEIAIPPYTQKRIIDSVRKKSTQAIFTSHSPFVLEEFSPSQVILIRRDKNGNLSSRPVDFPSIIKPKNYNVEFRQRFSDALLAKRVLLTEGITEANAYLAAGRLLNELAASEYNTLEQMGISVFNVMSDSSLSIFGEYFKSLGKTVYAVFDKQSDEALKKIKTIVDYAYESPYKGMEDLLIEETDLNLITKFYNELVDENLWPTHLDKHKPKEVSEEKELKNAVWEYLKWSKGSKGASELIALCTIKSQIPETIRNTLKSIKFDSENFEPTTSNTAE